jgi:hypothetical protein
MSGTDLMRGVVVDVSFGADNIVSIHVEMPALFPVCGAVVYMSRENATVPMLTIGRGVGGGVG